MERIRFDQEEYKEFFSKSFQQIYRPDDDSRFLLDAVENYRKLIVDQVKPQVCLEIGSGSGYVTNSISKSFGSSISVYYATDINPVAVETTLISGRANGVTDVHVTLTNLVDGVRQMLRNRVDLLVTNPPFEPSPLNDVGKPGAICAWPAGPTGRAIIDRILPELTSLMSDRGLVLMNCIEQNGVDDIRNEMKQFGFHSTIAIESHGTTSSNYDRIYHQYVLAFSKTDYWNDFNKLRKSETKNT